MIVGSSSLPARIRIQIIGPTTIRKARETTLELNHLALHPRAARCICAGPAASSPAPSRCNRRTGLTTTRQSKVRKDFKTPLSARKSGHGNPRMQARRGDTR
jgi:hypothetical protein